MSNAGVQAVRIEAERESARLQPHVRPGSPSDTNHPGWHSILPFTFNPFRTTIMFKHESPTINGFVILTKTPIRIMSPTSATVATLLRVVMISFVVSIYDTIALVTPDNIEHPKL
jgi:hypothetical protein